MNLPAQLAHRAGKGKRAGPGFRFGNGLSPELRGQRHNFPGWALYKGRMMDPMFDIPKNRKRISVLKLCVGIAFAVLMLLAAAPQVAEVLAAL